MKLQAEGLRFAYGDSDVVQDVSLEVREGELLGLIGPNGAGKSTLLALLAGALQPRAGQVRLEGQDVAALPRRTIARALGLVPQRCDVPFPVPVRSFVALGRYAHENWLTRGARRSERVVDEVLERLSLTPLSRRYVSELSGGEFRRVLIAQALAQEPRVLLLDEPIQQLDLRNQLEVMEFARRFSRDVGTSALVVLHELGYAARYCDRIALLSGGRLSALGSPAEVLTPERVLEVYGVHASIERDPVTESLQVIPVRAAIHTRPQPATPTEFRS